MGLCLMAKTEIYTEIKKTPLAITLIAYQTTMWKKSYRNYRKGT